MWTETRFVKIAGKKAVAQEQSMKDSILSPDKEALAQELCEWPGKTNPCISGIPDTCSIHDMSFWWEDTSVITAYLHVEMDVSIYEDNIASGIEHSPDQEIGFERRDYYMKLIYDMETGIASLPLLNMIKVYWIIISPEPKNALIGRYMFQWKAEKKSFVDNTRKRRILPDMI